MITSSNHLALMLQCRALPQHTIRSSAMNDDLIAGKARDVHV